jgi:hypothetical protein
MIDFGQEDVVFSSPSRAAVFVELYYATYFDRSALKTTLYGWKFNFVTLGFGCDGLGFFVP